MTVRQEANLDPASWDTKPMLILYGGFQNAVVAVVVCLVA